MRQIFFNQDVVNAAVALHWIHEVRTLCSNSPTTSDLPSDPRQEEMASYMEQSDAWKSFFVKAN